ncbi:flagellar hook-basal body complex protein [Sulfurimonas aquatica]|uniref:Flagellar hook-basal body complex protein n=1 Tax=Sulfurimonas aquatica TaxID=2672570 RepID=A0A975AY47_9BACT|nr:flagellar hook-basal body complex protein [Sulfurimonas aquatica]QSZ40620.1 flagellar hook-basal body complex protein [Sulfurimonas aquatica]
MMTQAFYTGLSGLRNMSTGIDIVSDNMSNNSTVGYRGYGVEFSNLFEEAVNQVATSSSVDSSIGVGVKVNATPMLEKNGELLLSDRSTDLAIDGDGWFGIEGGADTIYTRAGSFTFDANNDLVTEDGFHVLGTMANNIQDNTLTEVINTMSLGNVATQEGLRFPKTLSYPPQPTLNSSFYGNIGISDEFPSTISATVIDAQNNRNELKLTFTKAVDQNQLGTRWDVQAVTQRLDGLVTYDTQNGTVEFDSSGALVSSSLTSIDNNGTAVNMDLGSEFSGVVSSNVPQTTGSSSSDGLIGGDLLGYSININSEVIATFSNGEQSSVGKIAVYHFQNDQGLERISGSRFQESSNSGVALFSTDGNGNNILGATVHNFKLESSNYNNTAGLTELIILQRSYDANSKSITTADQMMQKALDMDA